MEDQYPDKIFVKDNLTSAEKLILAIHQIKDLKKVISKKDVEIGQLKSEIEHFDSIIQELPIIEKNSREDNLQIKKDIRVQELQRRLKELNVVVVRLRKDNADLINKLVSK